MVVYEDFGEVSDEIGIVVCAFPSRTPMPTARAQILNVRKQ